MDHFEKYEADCRRIRKENEKLLEDFGYPPEDWYENPILIREVMHPDWVPYFDKMWDHSQNDHADPGTYRL